MTRRSVIVASNRGPVSFVRTGEGEVVAKRGGGGLVTALTGALQASGGLWVASAMSEEDRERASRGLIRMDGGDASYSVRYLSFDPAEFDRYYNGISNRILWFLHHYLWDLPRAPRWDTETERAWADYRRVNESFAAALAEEGDALGTPPAYLVQDYHLSLVPARLRARRPDARISFFSHIPFAGPGYLTALPRPLRDELLEGMLGADVVGFHADAWADRFLLSCRGLTGSRVDLRRRAVTWRGRMVRVGVYPISIDVDGIRAAARSAAAASHHRALRRWLGDAKLVLRVDRTELSKNILRGLLAFEEFLVRHPDWRGRVRHLVLLNPSRTGVPEYGEYTRECSAAADRINERLGEPDWRPIEVRIEDDYPRVLAAYRLYDVLLVNPIFDGMNLVAKEGPALNRGRGVLVLSENAGAAQELGRYAITVNPFDIEATAEALHSALEMERGERARRGARLAAAVRRNRLERWVGRQLADLERDDAATR